MSAGTIPKPAGRPHFPPSLWVITGFVSAYLEFPMTANTAISLRPFAGSPAGGRTKAYELARGGEFPCHIIRIGDLTQSPLQI